MNIKFYIAHHSATLTQLGSWCKIYSLWPSDTIWWHKSGSTLTHVMACCLVASNHYLNQCWLIISKVQWHPSEINVTRDTSVTEISLKITYLNFCSNLPGTNELTGSMCCVIAQCKRNIPSNLLFNTFKLHLFHSNKLITFSLVSFFFNWILVDINEI